MKLGAQVIDEAPERHVRTCGAVDVQEPHDVLRELDAAKAGNYPCGPNRLQQVLLVAIAIAFSVWGLAASIEVCARSSPNSAISRIEIAAQKAA